MNTSLFSEHTDTAISPTTRIIHQCLHHHAVSPKQIFFIKWVQRGEKIISGYGIGNYI